MAVTSSLVPVDERGRETKQHGTSEFPAAAYRTRLYHAVPWHWHEYLEAGIVRQGTVRLAIGSSVYILQAGDGFFLNADTLHALRRQNREACELISLVFSPRIVAGSMESVFWQKYMSPLLKNTALKGLVLIPDAGWQERILQDIDDAWQAMEQTPEGYEFLVRSALSDLTLMLSTHMPEPAAALSRKELREEKRIRMMLEYIEEHFSEEISLTDIAGSAAVSESECLRCFRNAVHTSPGQYLKRLRVQKAAALLQSTGMKINEAAALCGFLDMSYFSGTFRKYYGMTPTAWRNQFHSLQSE